MSATLTIRAAERDVESGQPGRVAAAVPALVMLPHGAGGVAEPRDQGHDHGVAVLRVLAHFLVLGGGESPWLVEDRVRDEQLADIVQQAGPLQLVELGVAETELLAEQSAVRAHSLGVAASASIVEAQGGDELEHALGGLGGRATQLTSAGLGDAFLELTRRAVAKGDPEPRRCPVRERETQREQRRHWHQTPGETLGGDEHDGRCGGDHQPPETRGGECRRYLGERAQRQGCGERGSDGNGDDSDAKHPAGPRTA